MCANGVYVSLLCDNSVRIDVGAVIVASSSVDSDREGIMSL